MANKFPLILNTSANQIQEIASGDNLDLTGCKIVGLQGINSAGIVTFTKAHVGAATTWGEDLVVTGNARVTGILTVGTNSVTISGNDVNITGVTTASNFKTGTSNLHNVGLEIAGINVLGADTPIGTGATIYDAGGAVFTGVVTATNYVGTINTPAQPNITSLGTLSALNVSGNVSIGGTLTYEDVTNIDSVGLITARSGINISDTTQSTSTTTGSLKVAGGVGIVKNLNVGGTINANSNLNVSGDLYFDSDTDTTISNANTANWLRFKTGGTTVMDITSTNDVKLHDNRKLKIGASDDIQIFHNSGNNRSYFFSPQNNVYHEFNVANSWTVQTTAGDKRIECADNSTSLGVDLYHNGSMKLRTTNTGAVVTGICTATDFSGAAGGAADFPNGLTGTTATLSGSTSVSGDLDVAADIRHIGDENTRISFSSSDTIQLRTGGAPRVQIDDGNTTINNNIFLPDNVQLKIGNTVGTPDFKIYHDGNNRLHASNGYMQYRASAHYINDEGNTINFIRCENSCVKLHYGSGLKLETKTDGIEVTGNIIANGALTIKTSDADFVVQDPTDSTTNFIWRDHSGSRLYLGVAGTADIMARSNVSPLGGNTYDLGDTTNRWRNVYTNDLDLSNESKKDEGGNEVDGTWGAYTIQEGEDDLFLINRRSGKKYKFNLTEVS